VVILFLLLALVSFVLSLAIARMAGPPPVPPKPGFETPAPRARAKAPPVNPAESGSPAAPGAPAEPPPP